MAKSTVKISVKLPSGTKATRALIGEAKQAAQDVIDSQLQYVSIAQDLAAQGIAITADELAQRATGGKPAAKKKAAAAGPGRKRRKRKRVVLTAAQRKSAVADLKKGATIKSVADTYGCSPQTIMGIKKGAGLVKKKSAKKKAAKKKSAKKKAAKKK